MDKVFLWAFLHVVLGCQGLELSLERNNRATCGILRCVEESLAVSKGNRLDSDPSDTASQIATTSSLKVFKVDVTSANTNSGGKRRSLLASVSSQQPLLTRVSNGVKVDGRLEARRATLRLELTKHDDCLAEFVCQFRGVDTDGRELVSTSHIMQQPGVDNSDKVGLDWTPGPGIQVLSLIQQLDAKLAVVGSFVGNWEDEMRRLKDATQHDIESLKTDLNTKTDRLEDKIQYIGKDLNTQTDRLEDKMESLEKGLNTKFSHLEDKVETLVTRLEDKIESLTNRRADDKVDGSNSCSNGLSDSFDRTIKRETASLDANIATIKEDITSVVTGIINSVNTSLLEINQRLEAWEKDDQRLPNNLTQTSQKVLCENNTDVARLVSGGFHTLENNIQEKLNEMSLNINLSSIETHSLLRAQYSERNVTVGAELKSALTDLLKPKDCHKGMAAAAAPFTSSPYTVIQLEQGNSLVAPVLCDTFTDGGGWIVFQRRVTGDVNFYRGWEEYKHGFGSLDEDFWLGNENLYAITSTGVFELRIDMIYNGNFAFAHYDTFSVGDERSNYILRVAHYDGTAGDSFIGKHNGMPFTTHDRDNDLWGNNCAIEFVGAWWYRNCHLANLNGQWAAANNKGPRWSTLSGDNAVSFSEMKVRRVI